MAPELGALRKRIDELDEQLIRLLAKRAGLVAEIWAIKAAQGLSTRDPAREAQIIERLTALAGTLGLEPKTVEPFVRSFLGVSLRRSP